MANKLVTFFLAIALIVVVGFFIFKADFEPETTRSPTPTSTVKSFYETWTNYEGEDILEGTYRESDLITDSLIKDIETAERFDPILCAQDIPASFEVELISKSATSSVVQVKEYFGDKPSTHEVKLIKREKRWLINKVECHPGAKKQGDFNKTGNLVKNLPGLEEKGWFLSYEKPGQPGLAVKLEFDEESSCSFESGEGNCKEVLNDELIGTRVKVEGEREEEQVLVDELIEQ